LKSVRDWKMREGAGEEEEEEEEEEKGGEAKRAKLLYDFGRACYERPALVDTCTSPEVEEGKVMEVEEGRRRGTVYSYQGVIHRQMCARVQCVTRMAAYALYPPWVWGAHRP